MHGIDMKILTGLEKSYDGIRGHDVPILHQTKALQGVARLAIVLVERWGLVTCIFDGEDSSGRQKMRAMTSTELATAACDTAAALWQQIEERGWALDVPDPTPKVVRRRETEDAE